MMRMSRLRRELNPPPMVRSRGTGSTGEAHDLGESSSEVDKRLSSRGNRTLHTKLRKLGTRSTGEARQRLRRELNSPPTVRSRGTGSTGEACDLRVGESNSDLLRDRQEY
eukprot:jgi/Bigna1/146930/aug1.124_g21638